MWLKKIFSAPLGHEHWTLKIIDSHYLAPVWEKLRKAPAYLEDLIERDIVEDIKKISIGAAEMERDHGQSLLPLGKGSSLRSSPAIFLAPTGSTISCAMQRARASLMASSTIINSSKCLRILPSVDRGADELQLGIDENGLESCEALLLARHFMHRRIYQYSSVKAYNFHLRRYMKANYSKKPRERR